MSVYEEGFQVSVSDLLPSHLYLDDFQVPQTPHPQTGLMTFSPYFLAQGAEAPSIQLLMPET